MTVIDPESLRVEDRQAIDAWLGVRHRWVERQPITINEDGTVSAVLVCYRDPVTGAAQCRRPHCDWLDGLPECREEATITPSGPVPRFLAPLVPDTWGDE